MASVVRLERRSVGSSPWGTGVEITNSIGCHDGICFVNSDPDSRDSSKYVGSQLFRHLTPMHSCYRVV
jgi:hypothetical protein